MRSNGRLVLGKTYRLLSKWRYLIAGRFHAKYSRVYYIGDRNNWSIEWDARYISNQVRSLTDTPCYSTSVYEGITNQVVHFGSRNSYLRKGIYDAHPSNRVVLTWFHGNEADPNPDIQYMIRKLPESIDRVSKFVTSSTIAKKNLMCWGVPESKLAVIPLGVDLRRFHPSDGVQKHELRRRFGIPNDTICIGSFQKDGIGKEGGFEPKLVKGPDVLLDSLKILADKYNLFVLLTGPARGYVQQGLDNLKIPYRHTYLRNYEDIVSYYHCLDLYLVTSRDEGGPKAILESMATGVPIISTRVGMADDLIVHGENGLLAEIEDANGIAKAASFLIDREAVREQFIDNGLTTALAHDWSNVAMQYYNNVYKPLLND